MTHQPTAAPDPASPSPPDEQRWALAAASSGRVGAFAGVLLLAMCASTLVQFALGVLAPFLADDLGIGPAQIGTLTTAYFAAGALLSPFAGGWVDRVGGRRALTVLFATAGLPLIVTSVSPGYGLLLVAVVLAAPAIALGNPVTNALVAAHLPPRRRGLPTGVKQSGVQVGAAALGLALPTVAIALGWRAAVLVLVPVSLVGLLGVWALVPPTSGSSRGEQRAATGDRRLPASVWWLAGYAGLMGFGAAIIGAFLVLYGVQEVGMTPRDAGFVAGVLGVVATVARIAWGPVATRFRTASVPMAAMALLSIAGTGLAAGAAVWGPVALWGAALLWAVSASSWNSVVMLAVIRALPQEVTGAASGVVHGTFLVGLCASPVVFGATVDVADGYGPGWALVAAAFTAAAVVAITWRLTEQRAPGAA